MLETGTKAPDFELPDQNGEMHKLSDYAGRKVRMHEAGMWLFRALSSVYGKRCGYSRSQ